MKRLDYKFFRKKKTKEIALEVRKRHLRMISRVTTTIANIAAIIGFRGQSKIFATPDRGEAKGSLHVAGRMISRNVSKIHDVRS